MVRYTDIDWLCLCLYWLMIYISPNLAIMSVYLKLPSLTSVLWAVQLTALGCS